MFDETLDLKKLQKSGRVGRIDVDLKAENNKTTGIATVPSSLDQATTALIAASIESIEKVGPYNASFSLIEIEDFREKKRKEILKRAQEIMIKWKAVRKTEESKALSTVMEKAESAKPVSWGPDELPAGPEVDSSEELVIVEGRADVALLLSIGIKNIVATNGVNISPSLVELTKTKKKVTAFVDGDRVGEMILKELLRLNAKIDYVAVAPKGKEVEELSPSEALEILNKALPLQEYLSTTTSQKKLLQLSKEQIALLKEKVAQIKGKLTSLLLDENGNVIEEIPIGELYEKLDQHDNVKYLVFDGVVTQRLLDKSAGLGIQVIVGERIGKVEKQPEKLLVLRSEDLLQLSEQ